MLLFSWQGAAVVHLNLISGKHTSGLSQHLGLKKGMKDHEGRMRTEHILYHPGPSADDQMVGNWI